MNETLGIIHKIESFGTLDGPGIRTVIFLTGCDKRCDYCHNPDTWQKCEDTILLSPTQLFEKIKRYKSYYGKKGGVTVSGGEPLLQWKFVKEFFAICKQNGIHTALDTSGVVLTENIKSVLDCTDLVLLDIKMPDEERYAKHIGTNLNMVLDFLDYINKKNIPTIIRYVVVPKINDEISDFGKILTFLQAKQCVIDIELLPFHQMGKEKYEKLGIEYKLADLIPPTEVKMNELNLLKERFLNEKKT